MADNDKDDLILHQEDPVDLKEDTGELEILKEARERFAFGVSAWENTFEQGKIDHDFLAGEQWPPEIYQQRMDDRRPCLTINRLPQFVAQITNDMKMNPTSIDVSPVESDADESQQQEEQRVKPMAGGDDYSWAEVVQGLVRNIEYTSKAVRHYNRAAEQAVSGSVGWLRVLTEYAKWDSFDLDVKIKSIVNPWSVICDPTFTEMDASDMDWCFIQERMSRKKFEKLWPDATPGDLSTGDDDKSTAMQGDGDEIVVCEYFSREPEVAHLFLMEDGQVFDSADMPNDGGLNPAKITEGSMIMGLKVMRTKRVVRKKVVWRKITAWDILEGGEEGRRWPGQTIPVVPVLGKEIQLGSRRVFESAIRHARDPQTEYNYWRSAATEMVALAPKAPFIGPAECFEDNEDEWKEVNNKNYAYISYKSTPNGERPERNPMAQTPAAEIAQSMHAADDIKATVGIYDASLGARSNETSGRAILARQRESDVTNYHYSDARDRAVESIGRIVVEIIPKVFDTERVIRIRMPDEREDFVKINQTQVVNGVEYTLNDITKGKYDVHVSTGPAYSTARDEAVESLVNIFSAVPEMGAYAMDILAKNMNWPGADELARRLKRAVPQELLDQEDLEDRPEIPPTPQQQLEAKMAEDDRKKEEAKAVQKEADKEIAIAKAQEAVAQAGMTEEAVKNTVAMALAEVFAGMGQMPQGGMEPPPGPGPMAGGVPSQEPDPAAMPPGAVEQTALEQDVTGGDARVELNENDLQ